jgi:quercetin dioxygenase-like cupin family protein
MKSANLRDMIKGWFVGNFEPVIEKSELFEVAVKEYKAGDSEPQHYHRIATEITVVVRGQVQMCHRDWYEGDIIQLSPGESTSFLAITDATTVVVKYPSVQNDKFLV